MHVFRSVCRFLPVAALLALAVPGWTQQPARPAPAQEKLPTFSSDVKVVNVLATVRDKHGKIVDDLRQQDFILEEDGRRQVIRYFSRESQLPLTLGLLVDTSRSQRLSIEQERSAGAGFISRTLREGKDTAFLIHFDREVELLQDLTPSPRKLDAALQKMRLGSDDFGSASDSDSGQRRRPGDDSDDNQTGRGRNPNDQRGPGGPRAPRYHAAGTLLYDSIFLASEDVIQKQTGRKALIVLSDGVDHGSKTSLERAIRSAQRADTIVYAIHFAGEEQPSNQAEPQRRPGGNGPWGGNRGGVGFPGQRWPSGGQTGGGPGGGRQPRQQEQRVDGKKILERLAKETGGRMFEAGKKQPVDKAFAQIEDELRHQYSLGYTPDRQGDDGAYHAIRLTTAKEGLAVQTRDGYYTGGKPDRER